MAGVQFVYVCVGENKCRRCSCVVYDALLLSTKCCDMTVAVERGELCSRGMWRKQASAAGKPHRASLVIYRRNNVELNGEV